MMSLLAYMLHSVTHPGFLCTRLLPALYWHCQNEFTVVRYVRCANGAQRVGDPFGLDAMLNTVNDRQVERIKAYSSRILSSDPYLAKRPPQPQMNTDREWYRVIPGVVQVQASHHSLPPYQPQRGTGFPRLWRKSWLLQLPLYHSDAAGQALIYGRYLDSGQNETFCFQALFLF